MHLFYKNGGKLKELAFPITAVKMSLNQKNKYFLSFEH